jgi:hypothetical protein
VQSKVSKHDRLVRWKKITVIAFSLAMVAIVYQKKALAIVQFDVRKIGESHSHWGYD